MAHRQHRMYRQSRDRILLGVASGLAEATGLDPLVVRALFVTTALLGGVGLLVYLVLAALLPVRDNESGPVQTHQRADETTSILLVAGLAGVLLIGAGLAVMAVHNGWSDRVTVAIPWLIVLVTLVAGIIIGRRHWED